MKIFNCSGKPIFECNCETMDECLEEAAEKKINLQGAYLQGFDLRDIYLRGVDLTDANLIDVNLEGTNLMDADLRGANLWDEKLTKNPIYINAGFCWEIWITDKRIRIGCQIHSTKAWENFTDEQISKMSVKALGFWRVWKKPILEMAKAHQGG